MLIWSERFDKKAFTKFPYSVVLLANAISSLTASTAHSRKKSLQTFLYLEKPKVQFLNFWA